MHHLEDRSRFLHALRRNRLRPHARLLIVTRPQVEIDYPLWPAATAVWAAAQPAEAVLVEELKLAGFTDVHACTRAFACSVPVDQWCGLIESRFWSTFSNFTDEELRAATKEIRARSSSDPLVFEDRIVLISAQGE
mmetsp:Transcript_7919/g.15611  ORF Transcript_7919/g.15611 Transcript_7919/m.15611 type:complete len:136 (-) Transcript_7919:533-940(-)